MMGRIARVVPRAALIVSVLIAPASSHAGVGVGVSVAFGPPALPVYEQPPAPGDGYIWTPGYWAWDSVAGEYYWVPGTWVKAPRVGYLWTPPYWGWDDGMYIFHEGYWGPHVGFYGGVAYGFGYPGYGFVGGRWENGAYAYNRSVTNVDVTNVHNTYNENVTEKTTNNRTSYNGGPGGVDAKPRPEDEAAAREQHMAPAAAQTRHEQAARKDPSLRATANQGKPPVAATARAGDMHDHAVAAREAGGAYHAPARHPKELPALEKPADRQQQDLVEKQQKEREQLDRAQQQEHERMEQRHMHQTQHMQMHHMQQRHAAGRGGHR
jgi:hypothetical protein